MTPIKATPPGYVPTPKPRPTVPPTSGSVQQLTGSPRPTPAIPTRSTKANPIEAKHTLKYGQSLPVKTGTRPSAYAVANNLPPKPTTGLKKGGTTKLHSITKSSKKSNW